MKYVAKAVLTRKELIVLNNDPNQYIKTDSQSKKIVINKVGGNYVKTVSLLTFSFLNFFFVYKSIISTGILSEASYICLTPL